MNGSHWTFERWMLGRFIKLTSFQFGTLRYVTSETVFSLYSCRSDNTNMTTVSVQTKEYLKAQAENHLLVENRWVRVQYNLISTVTQWMSKIFTAKGPFTPNKSECEKFLLCTEFFPLISSHYPLIFFAFTFTFGRCERTLRPVQTSLFVNGTFDLFKVSFTWNGCECESDVGKTVNVSKRC